MSNLMSKVHYEFLLMCHVISDQLLFNSHKQPALQLHLEPDHTAAADHVISVWLV